MDNPIPTQDYKDAYTKGFSQAVKLFDYLCSKGVDYEVILDQLHRMIDEDIRPWQQKIKQTRQQQSH